MTRPVSTAAADSGSRSVLTRKSLDKNGAGR
jgi:hypothetical protein